jgi:hypothetical protein
VNSSQSGASFSIAFVNFSNSATVGSFNTSVSVAAGLSLSSFSSRNNLVFTTTSTAALVAVEGNSYSTVAVLDFGSQKDDESGDGRGRMPWLSTRHPVGDASPLARFVIGLDEALNVFRNEADRTRRTDDVEAPKKDPWSEDLFQRPRPARRPARPANVNDPPKAESKQTDRLNVPQPARNPESTADEQSAIDAFWQQCPTIDPPFLARSAEPRGGFRLDLSAMVLAGVLLTQNPRVRIEDRRLRMEDRGSRIEN